MSKTVPAGSVCIRCGKQRIVSKVWVDKNLPGNPQTLMEAVCPDLECQKLVDEEFAQRREKRLKFAR